MAFFEMQYYSTLLKRHVSINVIIPDRAKDHPDEKYKTLYLFHGLGDNHAGWVRQTSIERYAEEFNIAVVMPAVERSWYTDTLGGIPYFSFVCKELTEVIPNFFRNVSTKREDVIVGGLSMGGYGAVKAALTHPDKFGSCIALSASMDIASPHRENLLTEWRAIFDRELESVTHLRGTQHDLYVLAREAYEKGQAFPKMFIWCGESDDLLDSSIRFHNLLDELGVPHNFSVSEGNHTWKWWDRHIVSGLHYILSTSN